MLQGASRVKVQSIVGEGSVTPHQVEQSPRGGKTAGFIGSFLGFMLAHACMCVSVQGGSERGYGPGQILSPGISGSKGVVEPDQMLLRPRPSAAASLSQLTADSVYRPQTTRLQAFRGYQ